jgi:UDP:flavonoid glycosyltransferase YjiC (YdhE family)
MLALALGFRRAGHSVTFVAPPNFASWVGSFGFPFVGVGADVQVVAAEVDLSVAASIRVMRSQIRVQFEEMAPVVGDADVFIGAAIHCASPTFAEAQGVPYFYAFFSPLVLPSRFHPPPFVTSHGRPQAFNVASWKAVQWMWNGLARSQMNEVRRKLGLAPVKDVWGHIVGERPILAAETAIAPAPPDAPGTLVTTGPWLLPESGELEADLDAFLSAGPAPVYIGFGSMPDKHPEKTGAILVNAVRAAGVRAIISSGWAGLRASDLPAAVRVVAGPVPHEKLFPRCSAIVHHGGAGTTAAAARAGVPQIIVPHLFDQFHWAMRLEELGLSPPPIPKPQLTLERLVEALRRCHSDLELRRRAAEFRSQLLGDGVDRAVRHIESVALGKDAGAVVPRTG